MSRSRNHHWITGHPPMPPEGVKKFPWVRRGLKAVRPSGGGRSRRFAPILAYTRRGVARQHVLPLSKLKVQKRIERLREHGHDRQSKQRNQDHRSGPVKAFDPIVDFQRLKEQERT